MKCGILIPDKINLLETKLFFTADFFQKIEKNLKNRFYNGISLCYIIGCDVSNFACTADFIYWE